LNAEPHTAPAWFQGAIDLHVHSRPSIFPRLLDDHEVVQQAASAGMAGVVLKAHEGSTAARARLAETRNGAVAVRGGVVLNRFVGGINPHAVEMALAMGGAIVWMPTVHAHNHIDFYGEAGFTEQRANYRSRPVEPLNILESDGKLTQATIEVLEAIAAYPGAVLNNGHLGMEETALLFREARKLGIERLLVAHPELPLTGYSLDFQLDMIGLGAIIERCYLPHLARWGGFPIERTAAEIRRLGPENCVLSTDFGQVDSPPPARGLEEFARQLMAHGLSEPDVGRMIRENPRRLLGLG
jgi:hypothetical protein